MKRTTVQFKVILIFTVILSFFCLSFFFFFPMAYFGLKSIASKLESHARLTGIERVLQLCKKKSRTYKNHIAYSLSFFFSAQSRLPISQRMTDNYFQGHKHNYVTVHEKTRLKMQFAILHNTHVQRWSLCFICCSKFVKWQYNQICCEIMQFCFLNFFPLFSILYWSVLLKPHFLKKDQ